MQIFKIRMSRNLSKIMSRGKKTLTIIRHGQLQSAPVSNPFAVGLSTPSDLLERDLVSFQNYDASEICSILWIALDLKHKESLAKTGHGKSISMISNNPIRRLSLSSAGNKLGFATTFINPTEIINHETVDFEIFGKTVGSACDMVVLDCSDLDQKYAEEFATGCTVPVIVTESSKLCPIYCLSELLTLVEHYKYLRRLIIAFVGDSSDQLLNTYALLLPKLGMHLHYLIDGNMESEIWSQGIELSTRYNTEFKQFDNFYDSIYRSHIISVTHHSTNFPEITVKDAKEMDLDWTILHKDVYKKNLISKDLLRCQQSLVWKNILNMQWIFMATVIATTTTRKYSPSITRPQFEGQP